MSAGQQAESAALAHHFVNIVGQMLLVVEGGRNPFKPYFTSIIITGAISSLAGGKDREAIQIALQKVYWAPVLCLTLGNCMTACEKLHKHTCENWPFWPQDWQRLPWLLAIKCQLHMSHLAFYQAHDRVLMPHRIWMMMPLLAYCF